MKPVQYNIDLNLPFNPSTKQVNTLKQIKFEEVNSLKIMYLNARSLENKLMDLHFILNTIPEKIDILVITEVWLDKNKLKYIH